MIKIKRSSSCVAIISLFLSITFHAQNGQAEWATSDQSVVWSEMDWINILVTAEDMFFSGASDEAIYELVFHQLLQVGSYDPAYSIPPEFLPPEPPWVDVPGGMYIQPNAFEGESGTHCWGMGGCQIDPPSSVEPPPKWLGTAMVAAAAMISGSAPHAAAIIGGAGSFILFLHEID